MNSGLARLGMRAGAVVDGAVLRFMERAMSREADAPAEGAGAMLAQLAEAYGRAEHFARPESFFVPPPPAKMRARHLEDLAGGGAIVDLAWPSAHVPFPADYREEWAGHVERYGGLRGSSDRLAALDDWGLATTRRLLSTVLPPTPFGLG